MSIGRFWRLKCRCGSDRLRRSSRRNPIERVLGLFALPWRCEDCDRRSFKLAMLRPSEPPSPPQSGPKSEVEAKPKLTDRALEYSARIFDRGTGDSDL